MKRRGVPWPLLLYAAALGVCLLVPNVRATQGPAAYVTALTAAAALYLWRFARGKNAQAAGDITCIALALLLAWEVLSAKTGVANPIVVPPPEDVFYALFAQRARLLGGFVSSMELLLIGFGVALPLGVALGMLVGWVPRLKNCFFPIAKVLSPVPPSIYSPYIIAVMPSFRSASAMVLVLGLFWPTFLSTVSQVGGMDKSLLDAARVLTLDKRTMLRHVLLPYLLPSVIGSLNVRLSTSFLLLTLAEMMGAASGLGYFVRNNADYANYANVLAGILFVGAVVTLLNRLVALAQKKLLPWK